MKRFPTTEHLASYAGLVPTVHASGGKSVSRADVAQGQPRFALGLRGSSELRCFASAQVRTSLRIGSLRQIKSEEMPWQGGGGRRAKSGGIQLVDFKKICSLSAAACVCGRDAFVA